MPDINAKPLFTPSPEEPKTDPLFPQPIIPIFQGGDDPKQDNLQVPNIPQIFQGGGSQLVNYDSIDVLRNTGYIHYNIYTGSSGGIIVSDSSLNSTRKDIVGSWVPAGAGSITSGAVFLTADLKFNVPQTVKGDCFIAGFYRIGSTYTGAGMAIVSGAIFKYDGVTENLIGSWGYDNVGIAANAVYPFLIKINLPTTHFKIGEYLRIKEILNLKGTFSDDIASGAIFYKNDATITNAVTGTATTPINKISVPFKLDI